MSWLFNPEFLGTLNELLPEASAMGAYCMGIVTVLAERANLQPDADLLAAAADCETIAGANEAFEVWQALQVGTRSARSRRHA